MTTSLTIPVYLVNSLASTKACKQLSPRKQLGLTSGPLPCQTKTDRSMSLIETYGRKLWSMFLFAGHQNYNTFTKPQLWVGRIPLRNKYCHKSNNNEVCPPPPIVCALNLDPKIIGNVVLLHKLYIYQI
jgi:hypothetical protein